jgi:hypothetical protein
MTPRSIRRAAERRAKKLALKAARQAERVDVPAAASETTPELIDAPELEPAELETPQAPKSVPILDLKECNPITPAQLAANRANAQLSTGPRTAAGLAKSSKNAVKSGLTGRTVLLPTDDIDEYATFLAGYQHDFAPVGQAECELVQSVADTDWRLRRIRALEFALYAHGHAQFEAAFQDHPEEMRYTMVQLQTDMTYEKQFRNYHIHEARLYRRREKDMAELRRLQAERKSNQQEAKEESSDLNALLTPKPAVAQSAASASVVQNGFEFSTAAIHAANAQLEHPETVPSYPEAA